MATSKIIEAIQAIDREITLSQYSRIDPRRKAYLLARKRQLESEANAMSFTDEELKTNDIRYWQDSINPKWCDASAFGWLDSQHRRHQQKVIRCLEMPSEKIRSAIEGVVLDERVLR